MPERKIQLILDSLSAAEEAALASRPLPDDIGKPQFRRMRSDNARDGYDAENHTVTLTISSEFPVERWDGTEILVHERSAIDTSRLDEGISHLYNHNWDTLLGRTSSYQIANKRLSVTSKYGTNADAKQREQDLADGILPDVSLGYQILKVEVTEDKNGHRTYNVVRWMPYEWSSVTVPADYTVGLNRSAMMLPDVEVRFRKLDDAPEQTQTVAEPVEQTRSVADADDPDEDDEDLDEEERKKRSAEPPTTSPSTEPTQERAITMADAVVTNDPQQQNKERIAGLRQLRSQYGANFSESQLMDAITGETTIDQARTMIADAIIKGAEQSEVRSASEQIFSRMSDKERKAYSLRNVYANAINQRMPNTYTDKGAEAGFEREVSQELRRDAEKRGITELGGGILVPSASSRVFAPQLLQERTVASGGNAGAATNFTTVSTEIIELLRFKTVLLAMGARYMPGLHGAFQMPSQTGAATSNWQLEGGVQTSSDPSLGAFTMQPKRMSIANSYFRDFLAQSGLAIDPFLAADRQAVTGQSLDTAGLGGSGVLPVPLGLLNRTGLAAVLAGSAVSADGTTTTAGTGGKRMSYNDWVLMESMIATANADIGTIGIITTPRVRGAARTTPVLPGTPSGFVWPGSSASQGVQEGPLTMRAACTTNPVLTGFSANSVNNLHAAIMGVWDQLLIGDWDLSEIVVDPYTGAASAMVKITEHAYYDIGVRQLASFVACTSALPQ